MNRLPIVEPLTVGELRRFLFDNDVPDDAVFSLLNHTDQDQLTTQVELEFIKLPFGDEPAGSVVLCFTEVSLRTLLNGEEKTR